MQHIITGHTAESDEGPGEGEVAHAFLAEPARFGTGRAVVFASEIAAQLRDPIHHLAQRGGSFGVSRFVVIRYTAFDSASQYISGQSRIGVFWEICGSMD